MVTVPPRLLLWLTLVWTASVAVAKPWTPDSFPNPMEDISKCGRQQVRALYAHLLNVGNARVCIFELCSGKKVVDHRFLLSDVPIRFLALFLWI